MAPTWDALELPLLRAIAGLEDEGTSDLQGISDLRLATDLDIHPGRVRLALRRLIRAQYVTSIELHDGGGGPSSFLSITLLERGLRAAGAWPDP